jgi:hypothetical protein
MRRMLNDHTDPNFDRFKDALTVRASQVSQVSLTGNPNDYIAGYLFSFLEYGHDYESHIRHLEKIIAEWRDPDNDEAKLATLMHQHEPLRSA